MSFRSKVGEEVLLSDEDIAEILIRGEVWTIYTINKNYVISYGEVYNYTNLLRIVSEDEDEIFAKPVIPIRFDDGLEAGDCVDMIGIDTLVMLRRNGPGMPDDE